MTLKRIGVEPNLATANPADDLAPEILISLITGYWASQAVVAAVKTGLMDALASGPRDAVSLADVTGCDQQSMARLARYLTTLGVLERDAHDRYEATAVGMLLTTGSSFRDLALIYGNEFYQAWGQFSTAVRSGTNAFQLTFGVEHFDYFGQPEHGNRFNQMASATTELIAKEIGLKFDFSSARQVIDVGGGNGRLLEVVLAAAPQASGVIFERADVVAKVQAYLSGLSTRITVQAGDFFQEIPTGGDVYLLSRVLHDWMDTDCVNLLRNCRQAMDLDANLLVIERVLPEENIESLAFRWDMQMLAITGGCERTLKEYAELLAAGGFQLKAVRELPLDFHLLVSVPVTTAGPVK
jgi:O-methyltransferase domain/Dimerisation domain